MQVDQTWPIRVQISEDVEGLWQGEVFFEKEIRSLVAWSLESCWSKATEWLKERGVELSQEYDVEEGGDELRYVDYEQEA